MIYILIILGIILADQLSKWLIVSNLALGQSIPILGIFKITYVQNTGAAFSILTNGTFFLIILTVIFLAVIIYCWSKPFMDRYKLAAAVIIGGTLGNFIDRIFRGYVVDFFNFTYFPVFNIADMALCCGVGLIILQIFLDKDGGENGGREADNN